MLWIISFVELLEQLLFVSIARLAVCGFMSLNHCIMCSTGEGNPLLRDLRQFVCVKVLKPLIPSKLPDLTHIPSNFMQFDLGLLWKNRTASVVGSQIRHIDLAQFQLHTVWNGHTWS